jgi:hypothetical protein
MCGEGGEAQLEQIVTWLAPAFRLALALSTSVKHRPQATYWHGSDPRLDWPEHGRTGPQPCHVLAAVCVGNMHTDGKRNGTATLTAKASPVSVSRVRPNVRVLTARV